MSFCRREVMHEVQPAANFERAGRQMIFVLEENARAEFRVEQRVIH
jgi:hypothetical protein